MIVRQGSPAAEHRRDRLDAAETQNARPTPLQDALRSPKGRQRLTCAPAQESASTLKVASRMRESRPGPPTHRGAGRTSAVTRPRRSAAGPSARPRVRNSPARGASTPHRDALYLSKNRDRDAPQLASSEADHTRRTPLQCAGESEARRGLLRINAAFAQGTSGSGTDLPRSPAAAEHRSTAGLARRGPNCLRPPRAARQL